MLRDLLNNVTAAIDSWCVNRVLDSYALSVDQKEITITLGQGNKFTMEIPSYMAVRQGLINDPQTREQQLMKVRSTSYRFFAKPFQRDIPVTISVVIRKMKEGTMLIARCEFPTAQGEQTSFAEKWFKESHSPTSPTA